MREKIVAGNWKMNTRIEEAIDLIEKINQNNDKSKKCIVCVPFTHITKVKEIAANHIKVGAQNISQYKRGAYTGEISGEMLQSIGADYVLVGHSERRAYFTESNVMLKEKIDIALQSDISPIFCCGESLEMRENGNYKNYILSQIEESVFHLSAADFSKITIAYEPIWAIGTGKTASAGQAQEVHQFIREKVADRYGENVANNTTILYGGSVKPANATALFSCSDIDGGLIGGASLDADSFIRIINTQ